MSDFWKDSIRGRFGPGVRSWQEIGPGIRFEKGRSGRLPVVRTILSYSTLRDCVRGNYVLAKIG